MKINELSKRTGIHLETIRYYEKQGILPEPKRAANGYRQYDEESAAQLNFIKNCRMLGFSLEDIRELNRLKFGEASHYHADQMVLNQLTRVEEKIAQLLEIKHFLQSIATEGQHSEAECKAMQGLKKGKCG
ncbi:MerR family transcriptional regulator [Rodentibacter trehalosifermentans]|uniref:MerR family transcriptional regulator n=1 Tax=Rodentibacter trehalosifermentans TaxID=1908263 RepID=A0A1V3INE3_9PAST|nr:MerR family transcriptional regulator [Rodentibacter trehalosifermentans]OOF43693.1 MerR family transcriptional regulator [Rodentibacter trehalosifermentans]OOF51633.1 MerR family transcriptional regulator [Rodentibacter trehalosifermentans]